MRLIWSIGLVIACFVMAASTTLPARAATGEEEPLAGLRASVSLEGGVAYQKQDVRLRLTFSNPTPVAQTVPAEAVAPEHLTLVDDKGSTMSQVEVEGSNPSDIPIQGYDTASVILELSRWYPKVALKKRDWLVSWSYGPLEAPEFRFRVIEAFNPRKDTKVVIETDLGKIRWDLLPEAAPDHVKRFVDLARQGFYDGLTFHRYIPGLLLEGGDPKGDGTGAWHQLMPPEISPDLAMEPGLVAAARRTTSMTSDSMFFITLGPSQFMKGVHTFFARVTDGWTTIASFNQLPNKGRTGRADEFLLLEPVTIHSVTIR